VPHVNILADILDDNHKLLRLGNWLKSMTLSTPKCFTNGLLVILYAALLVGCQSSSPQKDNAISEAESASRLAEKLLAAEEPFAEAMREKDALAMIDAALAREFYLSITPLPVDVRRVAELRTRRMIKRSMDLAADDEAVLAEAQKRQERRSSLLDPDSSVFSGIGNMGITSKPSEFIKTLLIDAQSSFTMHLTSDNDIGYIIYVEHGHSEPIVLTVADSSGATVCEEKNPRGLLICRWKPEERAELTVTVSNNGKRATDVLLIKNQ